MARDAANSNKACYPTFFIVVVGLRGEWALSASEKISKCSTVSHNMMTKSCIWHSNDCTWLFQHHRPGALVCCAMNKWWLHSREGLAAGCPQVCCLALLCCSVHVCSWACLHCSKHYAYDMWMLTWLHRIQPEILCRTMTFKSSSRHSRVWPEWTLYHFITINYEWLAGLNLLMLHKLISGGLLTVILQEILLCLGFGSTSNILIIVMVVRCLFLDVPAHLHAYVSAIDTWSLSCIFNSD